MPPPPTPNKRNKKRAAPKSASLGEPDSQRPSLGASPRLASPCLASPRLASPESGESLPPLFARNQVSVQKAYLYLVLKKGRQSLWCKFYLSQIFILCSELICIIKVPFNTYRFWTLSSPAVAASPPLPQRSLSSSSWPLTNVMASSLRPGMGLTRWGSGSSGQPFPAVAWERRSEWRSSPRHLVWLYLAKWCWKGTCPT